MENYPQSLPGWESESVLNWEQNRRSEGLTQQADTVSYYCILLSGLLARINMKPEMRILNKSKLLLN